MFNGWNSYLKLKFVAKPSILGRKEMNKKLNSEKY